MTIQHNEVFIPNGKVLSEAVVNVSLPDRVQARKLIVGVSYSVPLNRAKNAILEVLSSVPRVLKSPAPIVRVINYGGSFSDRGWVENNIRFLSGIL